MTSKTDTRTLRVSLYILFPADGPHRVSDLEKEIGAPQPTFPEAMRGEYVRTPMLSRIAHAAHTLMEENPDKPRVAFMGAGGAQHPTVVVDRRGFGQVVLSVPGSEWSRQFNY